MKSKVTRGLTSIVMVMVLVLSAFSGLRTYAVGDVIQESDYLTFTAEQDGSSVTIMPFSGTLEYNTKISNETDWSGWSRYDKGSPISLNNGDSVRFRGQNIVFDLTDHVEIGGKVACSGDVMSLRLDSDGKFAGLSENCFSFMFRDCTNLTSAPKLSATTLANSCYLGMFESCTNLTTPPALSATILKDSCYSGMFSNCRNLTTAPTLPATTLEVGCYAYMFQYCTKLTTPPALRATTLANYCYEGMFAQCKSIMVSENEDKTNGYNIPYRVPSTGDADVTNVNNPLSNMFVGTGGTFTGTPEINKTYYLKGATPATVDVTDVSISPSNVTLAPNSKRKLTATVSPEDATDKKLKWSVEGDNLKLYSDADCTTELSGDAVETTEVYVKNTSTENYAAGKVKVESNADSTKSAQCEIAVPPDFYVAGNGTAGNPWVSGASWSADSADNKMTFVDNIYTMSYKAVPAGTYAFKLPQGGSWDVSYGLDTNSDSIELNKEFDIKKIDGDDTNVKFKLNSTSDVTIVFDYEKMKVKVSAVSVVEPKYTISIPAALDLNSAERKAAISASEVALNNGQKIIVTLDSAGNTDKGSTTFHLKNANNDNTLTYTINAGNDPVAAGGTAAEFTASGESELAFSKVGGDLSKAGTYTETLIFGVRTTTVHNTISDGEVLQYGDVLNPNAGSWILYVAEDSSYTFAPQYGPFMVVRGNIDENRKITETPDGAYYFIRPVDGDGYSFWKKEFPATENSEGLKIEIKDGHYYVKVV